MQTAALFQGCCPLDIGLKKSPEIPLCFLPLEAKCCPYLFTEFWLGVIPPSLRPLHKVADACDCISAHF